MLDGDQVDGGELQSLGCVQRHQRHRTGLVVERVDILREARRLQEARQRRRLLTRLLLVVLPRCADQFFDVAESLDVVFVIRLELPQVSGPLQDPLQQFRDRPGAGLSQLIDQVPRKFAELNRAARFGRSGTRAGLPGRVEQRRPRAVGPTHELVE